MDNKLYVPNEILRTLKEEFPFLDLSQVEWSWEVPYKIYEAEFEVEGVEHEVEITVTGHLLCIEHEIELTDLPEGVAIFIAEGYPDATIEEAEMVTYSNDDVCYEVQIKHNGLDIELMFREDAMFIAAGTDF